MGIVGERTSYRFPSSGPTKSMEPYVERVTDPRKIGEVRISSTSSAQCFPRELVKLHGMGKSHILLERRRRHVCIK